MAAQWVAWVKGQGLATLLRGEGEGETCHAPSWDVVYLDTAQLSDIDSTDG